MKKLAVILLCSMVLFSCGKDKKNDKMPEKVAVDQYKVILDAVYEKDDSLSLVYMEGGYFRHETPVIVKVKGSPMVQKVTFEIPAGAEIENVAMLGSSNKDQKYLKINSISILKGDKAVLSDKDNYTTYFGLDESFTYDGKLEKYVIDHNKKYPPGIVGNDQLLAMLEK